MKNNDKHIKKLARQLVENGYHDKDTDTLFVSNPGISFEVLKGLAKKHNFTLGQTRTGEFVSIPTAQAYSDVNGKFSLYDNFLDTYTYFNRNYESMLSAYKVFDLIDENVAEVGLMLDTYAAEILAQGFVENPLKIKINNTKAQKIVEKILVRNNIYQRLPNITRSIAKYGNYGMLLSYPYLETWMNSDDPDAFSKINVVDDLDIAFVNPKYFKACVDEYYNVVNYETEMENTFVTTTQKTSAINRKTWQPWQFVHFSIPDELTEPYGKSMLWSMRSAFDQLTTLEAFLAISRASKIQRLVFYVPLPNGVSMVDSYGFMNEFKSNYLNSVFTDMGSVKGGRKIPGAMSVLTLPKAHDGTKIDVDHIESNIDLSSVEDVEYFMEKIFRNSNLPKGYLVGDDVITTVQTLEAQDLKLKRTLLPLKRALITGMMNLVENVLAHAGFDISKLEVEVSLNEPIQIPSDVIGKYGEVCELLGTFMEMNPEMPDVNKFQILVKMGMPVDLASLVCAKSAINVLATPEDLGKFLIGQKQKRGGATMPDPESMEEACSMSLKSRDFFASNRALNETLLDFYNVSRTSTDRSLKESLLKGNYGETLTESISDE